MPNPSQPIVWQSPPADLALGEAEVHVWFIGALDPAENLAAHINLLSPAELNRAEKFHFDQDRRLFIACHAAVRAILERYLDTPAADIEFVAGVNGKPSLAPALAASGIEFNLSHSHRAGLFAVSRDSEVGVDIEFVKTDFTFDDVAGRFFTPREVSALRALPNARRRQVFYKCWTSKEAFLKAKGTGLSGQLDEVEINREDGRIQAAVKGWSLTELNPGPGYEAAVVTKGAPCSVRLYRWQA
ncbi:MAG TPA: 4'-phosphopantetheinyl transferase superfamily protein [Verrucomicrobiae bacterium]|nr:4'-phosphopantetheinyl transferase superfamily protein [Verrucomicrobiae bacterium]